jgi:hypothetical protein
VAIGVNTNISSADISGPGATVTITKPTGTASTDILIICLGEGWASGSAMTVTAPSGWTSVGNLTAGSNPRNIRCACFWSLGSNTNLGFTVTNGSTNTLGWVCVGFTGVDNTTPIDATGTTNSSTAASSLTTNAVTVVTDQAWHVIAAGDWLGKIPFTATSFTEKNNAGVNESAMILYNTTPKGTGSTGTVVINDSDGTATSQVIAGIPFALRPASGGATFNPGWATGATRGVIGSGVF